MNHALTVGIADRLTNGLEHAQPAARAGTFLPQQPIQCLPVDQLHDQIGPTVGQLADLMHRGNAGMLQAAGQLRLVDKACHGRGIVGEAGLQVLQDDVALEGEIAGRVDDAHAALADLVEDRVAGWSGGPFARLGRGGLVRQLGRGVGGVIGWRRVEFGIKRWLRRVHGESPGLRKKAGEVRRS